MARVTTMFAARTLKQLISEVGTWEKMRLEHDCTCTVCRFCRCCCGCDGVGQDNGAGETASAGHTAGGGADVSRQWTVDGTAGSTWSAGTPSVSLRTDYHLQRRD